jgi:uncharacterized protein YjbI with pentapeptide repeats
MSKTVIVGTEEFEIPLEGENPGYGEQLSDFFVAVADALQNVQQPNDILSTAANIANNVTTPTNIPGFSFDTAEVQSINSEFLIKRTTDVPAQVLTESGFVEGNFDGTNWSISIRTTGGYSGVDLSITPSGQIQYVSTDLTGSNYAGQITFRAKVFNEI